MGFPRRRKDYENELLHLINEDTGCFVEHVARSPGWDLIAAPKLGEQHAFIPIEVKTSINTVINLASSKRTREQIQYYRLVQDRYGIPTIYAYRLISRSRGSVRDKWRFFTARKNKLVWTAGKTYDEFIKHLKQGGRLK